MFFLRPLRASAFALTVFASSAGLAENANPHGNCLSNRWLVSEERSDFLRDTVTRKACGKPCVIFADAFWKAMDQRGPAPTFEGVLTNIGAAWVKAADQVLQNGQPIKRQLRLDVALAALNYDAESLREKDLGRFTAVAGLLTAMKPPDILNIDLSFTRPDGSWVALAVLNDVKSGVSPETPISEVELDEQPPSTNNSIRAVLHCLIHR